MAENDPKAKRREVAPGLYEWHAETWAYGRRMSVGFTTRNPDLVVIARCWATEQQVGLSLLDANDYTEVARQAREW